MNQNHPTLLRLLLAAFPIFLAHGTTVLPDPSLYAATGAMTGGCASSDTEVPPQTAATASLTNCNMGASSGTAAFTGSSTVTYTGMEASASMSLTDATFASGSTYSSYGRIIDNLDILSGGSSIEYISLGIALDGVWSDNGLGFVKPVLSFGFDYDGNPDLPFTQTSLPLSNGSVDEIFWTPAYPIADFEDYDYFISLSLQTAYPSGSNITGSSDLNFSDTVSIQYVDAINASGQTVSNAVISSEGLQNSGQTDVDFTIGTPEPPSLFLGLATSIVSLLGLRSRKIRNRLTV